MGDGESFRNFEVNFVYIALNLIIPVYGLA